MTLSACQTALGKRVGGEGFLGFSQALFVAGARSLVLSLWKVNDTATALLMTRFYQNLLGRHKDERTVGGEVYAAGIRMSKIDALREAKRWLRNLDVRAAEDAAETVRDLELRKPPVVAPVKAHRPYEHPYYWASFILIGDPE